MTFWEQSFTVPNADRHALSGIFTATRALTSGDHITLLCHGHTSSKRAYFLTALTSHLLSHYPPNHGIARFDFSGNGSSEGTFRYANYTHEAGDILSVVRWLKEQGYVINGVVGHSKAATSCLLFMGRYGGEEVKRLVCLAGRWRMERGIEERFGRDAIEGMKNGEVCNVRGKKADGEGKMETFQYGVTYGDIRERVATDVEGAVKGLAEDVTVLVVHGENDKIIPVEDAALFEEALKERGVPVNVKIVEGGMHDFKGDEKEVGVIVARFCNE